MTCSSSNDAKPTKDAQSVDVLPVELPEDLARLAATPTRLQNVILPLHFPTPSTLLSKSIWCRRFGERDQSAAGARAIPGLWSNSGLNRRPSLSLEVAARLAAHQ
jgi:hypothetical protein